MTPFELSLERDLNLEWRRFASQWLFQWHGMTYESGKVDVERFDGTRIQYAGIRFGDQQRQVFWHAIGNYLDQKIHEIFKRWDAETREYPNAIRRTTIERVELYLKQFTAHVIAKGVDTDLRLRSSGRLEDVSPYDAAGIQARSDCKITQLGQVHRTTDASGKLMYAEPTINDFLAMIGRPLEAAIKRAQGAVEQVARDAARTGQTGYSVVQTFDVVRKEFDSGVQATLGRLRQVAKDTSLDRSELRQLAAQRLENFAIAAKSVTNPDRLKGLGRSPGLAQYVDEQLTAFDSELAFQLRQFDVGFFTPHGQEVPQVSNSINVNNMIGSAIAQGSPSAKQSVEFTLDAGTARAALATFETDLKATPLSEATRASLGPEIETLRAQLSKPSPSKAIVREAGQTLRNIVEGIGAGLLTPETAAAATALWSALGLG
jgi:hypothetical protein